MVESLLDTLTDGEHSRAVKQLEKSDVVTKMEVTDGEEFKVRSFFVVISMLY